MQHPVLWIHGEALGPANPALQSFPGRPAVFVFDTELLAGRSPTSSDAAHTIGEPVSLKRIGFLYDCLLELPVSLRRGDVAEEVLAFAERHGADGVVTTQATDPRFSQIAERIAAGMPLEVLPVPPFVPGEDGQTFDLGRFGRYWRLAEPLVWRTWQGER
jgi:deoxyribodipyrimidine photo-lyase